MATTSNQNTAGSSCPSSSCAASTTAEGQDSNNVKYGNSFSQDGLPDLKAHYLISNPPFGVDWSKAQAVVKGEHEARGHSGRFGPGLPRKNLSRREGEVLLDGLHAGEATEDINYWMLQRVFFLMVA